MHGPLRPPDATASEIVRRIFSAGSSPCAAWRRAAPSRTGRSAPGGRLVAITAANRDASTGGWRHALPDRQPAPDMLFTRPIARRLYRSRGTTYETRLTVIEKPGGKTRGTVAIAEPAASAEELLSAALDALPARLPLRDAESARPTGHGAARRRREPRKVPPSPAAGEPAAWRDAQPLAYTSRRTSDAAVIDDDRPYHPWTPSVVIVENAKRHPTTLVQSAAMSAVDHRRPAARPVLPARLVTDGTLSDAQLESIVLAAEAHSADLPGRYSIDSDYDNVRYLGPDGPQATDTARRDPASEANVTWSKPTALRCGWMLGDGTGYGKGCQVTGINPRPLAAGEPEGAFKIIHHNLGAALEATGIDTGDACDARAKAVARSAFELAKQRFFSHLLTSMKCPTLIASIEDDLRDDFAPVVQIVSTGEALAERRLS